MKKNKLVRAFLLIFISLTTYNTSWPFSKDQHAGDMVEVFFGNRSYHQKEFRLISKQISSTIDNFLVIDEINSLYKNNGIRAFRKGEHRVYGHWGFSSDISQKAFNEFYKNIEIADHLTDAQKSKIKAKVKNIIVKHWVDDVSKINKLVGDKFPGLTHRQAKGISGIIYDVHILGDHMSTNSNSLKVLTKIEVLKKDIKINIHRALGNRSNEADELIKRIDPLFKGMKKCTESDNVCKKQYWDRIRQELGKSKSMGKKVDDAVLKEAHIQPNYKMTWNSAFYSGLTMALFRNAGLFYNAYKGKTEWTAAAEPLAVDTVGYTVSVKIVNGVVVKVGERFAIMSWLPKASSKIGGEVMVAMFVFDSAKIGFSYLKGDLDRDEFVDTLEEKSKETIKSIVAISIAMAVIPGGQPMIIGVALTVGSAILIEKGIDQLHEYYKDMMPKEEITIEDMEKMFQISFKEYFTPYNPPVCENMWKLPTYNNSFNATRYNNSFNPPTYKTPFDN